VLAWDVDFNRDLGAMASERLDAMVTDDLADMLERKDTLARQLA
jgi:hypothetical protein